MKLLYLLMLNDYYYQFVFKLSIKEIIANILVAMICGAAISFLYRKTYKGVSYSASFANSIIMLTMITALVLMVIGNNLARAFGLVGAMSIIRFRTAVKDSQDIMFIFFALAIGLASGVGYYNVAIIGTVCVGTLIFLLTKFNFSSPKKRDFLLQLITSSRDDKEIDYYEILKKYCKNYKLVNVKAIGDAENELLEISFYVNLKSEKNNDTFVKELKKTNGIQQVNLFFDEE